MSKCEMGVTCWSLNREKTQLMKDLGCTEFYSTIEWCNVHKGPDNYHWSYYDREFALEEEFGLKSIRNILHTPIWASGVNKNNCKFKPITYPPRTIEYYGRFCANLVKRFPGRTWVMGGEVDNNWPREEPRLIQWAGDMETYVEMAKYAYVEMKKADETCLVGLSSLVSATLNGEFDTVVEDGKKLSKLHNFDRMLELYLDDYCDFIPIDLYCYGYGGVRNFTIGIRKIKEVMAKYEVKKPIYITETGAKITPTKSKMHEKFHHEIVTEETQAGFLMKAYKLACEANIEKMFWLRLKDSNWGLVNRLGKKHMSYYAFKSIKRSIMED